MKKIILLSVLLLALVCKFSLKAQSNDSFFDHRVSSGNIKENRYEYFKSDVETDYNRAPLGGGFLILAGLAVGYAIRKNKESGL